MFFFNVSEFGKFNKKRERELICENDNCSGFLGVLRARVIISYLILYLN